MFSTASFQPRSALLRQAGTSRHQRAVGSLQALTRQDQSSRLQSQSQLLVEKTQTVLNFANPSLTLLFKPVVRLVDPLGHAQKAPHLREGHRIQAAHGTETVQAQEVDPCRVAQVCTQVDGSHAARAWAFIVFSRIQWYRFGSPTLIHWDLPCLWLGRWC